MSHDHSAETVAHLLLKSHELMAAMSKTTGMSAGADFEIALAGIPLIVREMRALDKTATDDLVLSFIATTTEGMHKGMTYLEQLSRVLAALSMREGEQ